MYSRNVAAPLIAFGAVRGIGGAWRVTLGGFLTCPVDDALPRRWRRVAVSLFGVILSGTLIGGFWETGLDRWALPQGRALLVVIVIIMAPVAWAWRSLAIGTRSRHLPGRDAALAIAFLISSVAGVWAFPAELHDRDVPISEATMDAAPFATEKAPLCPRDFGRFNHSCVASGPSRQAMIEVPVNLAFTAKYVARQNVCAWMVTGDGDPVVDENSGAPVAVALGAFRSFSRLPRQRPCDHVAVDLTGAVHDRSPQPPPFETGVPGIGGRIVSGGVAFPSDTLDFHLRGCTLAMGAPIWRARFAAGGHAARSICDDRKSRQNDVVVAGGHGSSGIGAGDAVTACALPDA